MDSHDQQVQLGGGSQQTRLPGFFKNVHSKFSGFSKEYPKGEDIVITSQVLRNKPQLVIGNASNRVSPPEPSLQPNAGAGTKRRATTEVEVRGYGARLNVQILNECSCSFFEHA